MEEHRKAAGQRLAALRQQMQDEYGQQWSQEKLAHEAGVSVKTVGRFERGVHDGRGTTVKKLAKALGVDPEAITGPPPPPLGLGGRTQLDDLQDQVAALTKAVDSLVSQIAAERTTRAVGRAASAPKRKSAGSQRKSPAKAKRRKAG